MVLGLDSSQPFASYWHRIFPAKNTILGSSILWVNMMGYGVERICIVFAQICYDILSNFFVWPILFSLSCSWQEQIAWQTVGRTLDYLHYIGPQISYYLYRNILLTHKCFLIFSINSCLFGQDYPYKTDLFLFFANNFYWITSPSSLS